MIKGYGTGGKPGGISRLRAGDWLLGELTQAASSRLNSGLKSQNLLDLLHKYAGFPFEERLDDERPETRKLPFKLP